MPPWSGLVSGLDHKRPKRSPRLANGKTGHKKIGSENKKADSVGQTDRLRGGKSFQSVVVISKFDAIQWHGRLYVSFKRVGSDAALSDRSYIAP